MQMVCRRRSTRVRCTLLRIVKSVLFVTAQVPRATRGGGFGGGGGLGW